MLFFLKVDIWYEKRYEIESKKEAKIVFSLRKNEKNYF